MGVDGNAGMGQNGLFSLFIFLPATSPPSFICSFSFAFLIYKTDSGLLKAEDESGRPPSLYAEYILAGESIYLQEN